MACRIKSEVASPCVNICRMDAENQHCIGCWRTLDEITRWASLSEAERAQVMAALPERMGL